MNMVTNITIYFEKSKGSEKYFHYLSVDYKEFLIIWLENYGNFSCNPFPAGLHPAFTYTALSGLIKA